MQREKSLTPKIRQVIGLPDEIRGVPVAEGYPGIHAQAIDPGARCAPPAAAGLKAPPSSGLLVLYLPYAVVLIVRHIENAG